MAQILVALKDNQRWHINTVIDAFDDDDDMNSFPKNLYDVVIVDGSADIVRDLLQSKAGDAIYIKNLTPVPQPGVSFIDSLQVINE